MAKEDVKIKNWPPCAKSMMSLIPGQRKLAAAKSKHRILIGVYYYTDNVNRKRNVLGEHCKCFRRRFVCRQTFRGTCHRQKSWE